MNEKVLSLGSHQGMVAVLSQASQHASDTLVVFLNAGLLPRVGPFRLHVTLGRHLDKLGFDHLRLDQAKLGDSRERSFPSDPLQRAFLDISETLDALEKDFGYRKFILFGLCAGAYTALLYAPRDPRVRGLILLDLPVHASRGYWLRRLLQWTRWRKWRNLFIRRFGAARQEAPASSDLFNPPSPSLSVAEIDTALEPTLARGAHCLWVYTGDSPFRFNSHRQFGELFPKLITRHSARLRLEWKPQATHLYSFGEDRRDLIKSVEDWLKSSFRTDR
jgi:pimeloyl-ACP methyl ester carboxylesterase